MKFKMVSSLLRRLPSTVWSHTLSRLKGTLNAVQEEEVRRQCRRRKERVDSVTPEILLEREKYLERIQQFPLDREVISRLQKEGFGRKRKLPTLYTQVYSPEGSSRITNTAAGGFATFMAAATRNWPIFQHMLPEIAFAGHSNCGKSTLVNGMIGLPPNKGKASVAWI